MHFKRKKEYLLKEVAGDSILIARGSVALEVNGVYIFNESGALLWKNMTQYTTIEKMADILTSTYEISREQAIADVRNCIEKMIRNNLIEVKEK